MPMCDLAPSSLQRLHGFFIWAGGRVGDPTLIPDIAECFRRANDKIEIAGITAWAYGKLGAMEELEVFAKELADMFPNAAADGRG